MQKYRIFKDVLKLLKRNKRQSILTAIAIGIATFVVLMILSSQSYTFNALSEDMDIEAHTTSLTFTPHHRLNQQGFTSEDQKLIEKHTSYHPRLVSSSYGKETPIEFENNHQILSYRTLKDLDQHQITPPEILKGKDWTSLKSKNGIAISDKALMKLTRQPHIENYIGATIKINGHRLFIQTIYQSSAVKEVLPDVLISEKTVQYLFKNHIFYDQLDVDTDKPAEVYDMLSLLDKHGTHAKEGTYDFIDNTQVYKDTKAETSTILNFIALLSSISIFVAGFGVMNALFSTISERSKEIAIRRALGAKKSHIYTSYIIEGTLLSFFGGILGVIAALIMIALMNLSGMVASVSIVQVVITLTITAVFGVLFSIIPAMVAAHKNVVEGLR
ncbi:ABC transporter permease [Staphylococcus canis]|uniref:ABC transporter permease n=1 Tax=Staphylococcus canis TaxID=2724942 RepID=A0ABS0T9N9_9STAP|nr:ABC transporter permease [Staphylococcus canis]MBI5975275.1 ABC transporter permease [Staphylococcus canis]